MVVVAAIRLVFFKLGQAAISTLDAATTGGWRGRRVAAAIASKRFVRDLSSLQIDFYITTSFHVWLCAVVLGIHVNEPSP